jgi:transaldolase/glucose-6-phosphate isomerase
MSTTAVNERLAALTAAGTSVWLDQLRRGMIESGELQRMIEQDSLRGVTSNPAIFEKAILGTADYDEDLARLAQEGKIAREVYRYMALKDVQLAADALRPVYDDTGGLDGYVSWEVAPRLAHDTEGTIEQAHQYWDLVDRPNLMIKVPATEEGLPAIEQLLYEGMNINVTLLFAVSAYEKVMERFVRALERRHEDGRPLDRHSVASFFVSRVDSEVDKRLEALGRTDLQGRAGLANARAAYQAYKRVFEGERFAELRAAGAPVQRPLWASTGVKNPQYPETLYVWGLAAPNTVNTMPLPTLLAAGSEGELSGGGADEDPTADLEALRDAGIDLDDVTDKLLRDGIDAFLVPMAKLLDGIERKREAVVTGRPAAIDTDLPTDYEEPVTKRVKRAADEDVERRIWAHDGTLWAPEGTPEVTNRLGWLTIGSKMLEDLDSIQGLAEDVRAEGYTDAVLLGMGGSSLAPEVFRRSLKSPGPDALRLHVLDSTDPAQARAVADAIDLDKTLFIVSSKSGGTIETLTQFEYFHSRQPDGKHFVAITDPGSGLLELAQKHGFRRAFENDPDIGGRYSALSYFGLVPAALAGVDVGAVLETGEVAVQNCEQRDGNIGLWLGLALGELALHGRDKLTFVIDDPIGSFGLWAEQLVAESTGKQGRGILPIADEPLADPGSYGSDRVFLHLADEEAPDDEHAKAMAGLSKAGHPVLTLRAHGVEDLGRIYFLFEFATAVAGWVLEINPFDQPNVQEAKDNTARVLERGAGDVDEGDVSALLEGLEPPGYVAILGFLPYSDAVDAAIERLRARLIERFGVATTWGYGPRYLHSTGQFHKGGPATGRFLELVHDSDDDLEIPGRSFGFRTLISAQADGDLQTLRDHGLSAARVRLSAGDLAGGIDAITGRI